MNKHVMNLTAHQEDLVTTARSLKTARPLESSIRRLEVLVVDDSAEDTELIAYELERGGLQARCVRVDTAGDLTAALRRQEWDLVLTDYTMPKLNASTAFALIRAACSVPCVLVSGTATQDTARAAMELGLDDFVTKQNLSALCEVVRRALADAERRQAWRASPRVRLQGGQEFQVRERNFERAVLEGSRLRPGQDRDALLLADGDVAPVHLQVLSCQIQALGGSEPLYQSIVTMLSDDVSSGLALIH